MYVHESEQGMELAGALLEQLDTLAKRHGLAPGPETLSACAEMGLIPSMDGDGALAYLDEAGWYQLLHGIARREPGLAFAVAAACRGAALHAAERPHLAYSAQPHGAGWLVETPCSPEEVGRYVRFQGTGSQLLRVVSAVPARTNGRRVLTWRVQAMPQQSAGDAGSNPVSEAERQGAARDLLALRAGALAHAWRATLNHALERPMFQRMLSDFANIRLRLLEAYAMLGVIDVLSAALCGLPLIDIEWDNAWPALCALSFKLRDELQQIGGGTGYMAETQLSAAIQWLGVCDEALAHGSGPCDGRSQQAVLAAACDYLGGRAAQEGLLPPDAYTQLFAVIAP